MMVCIKLLISFWGQWAAYDSVIKYFEKSYELIVLHIPCYVDK